MKKKMLILLMCVAVMGVAQAENEGDAYEKTIRVRDDLPPYTIRMTDTGENTSDLDDDNILLAEILSPDGTLLQSFTYLSNETPDYNGVAELVMTKDLNFDGYQDLMLLTAAGARNVFHAISIWDSWTKQFRPVEQTCEWDCAASCFSDEITQVELCNVQLFPEKGILLSEEQDGFRYQRSIYYMFDGTYSLSPKYIWDVYDAGEGLIGESLTEFMTKVVFYWDEQYPEEWYYGQEGVAEERRQAVQGIALYEQSPGSRYRVAHVDWVNLRKQDSKASPSLAQLDEGETVTVLVDDCGPENGWVRVLYSIGENQGLTLDEYESGRNSMTGYIWHSFLEPIP